MYRGTQGRKKPVLALCGSGLCLKTAAAILVAGGNAEMPLTGLMTHTLPGGRVQQQREAAAE